MADKESSYIANFITLDNMILHKISEEETSREDAPPSIGQEVGKFLGLLIRLMRAQRVLELGTSLGYSTIWLAEALRSTGGMLISVECNEILFKETQQNVSAAGLANIVELILGDARLVIEQIAGPFDLILQDSDKTLYPVLLEKCIALIRTYGILVADDALFKPRGVRARLSKPIDEYNRRVFSDGRFYSTILPIGDGITLSVKLKD